MRFRSSAGGFPVKSRKRRPGRGICCGAIAFVLAFAGAASAAPPAPPPFDRLLKDGGAKVEFYDPATMPRDFPGRTTFTFVTDWKFDFKYDFLQRNRILDVSVRVTMSSVESSLTHQVELPVGFDHARLWETKLARHELDHVLLTTDPRIRLLNKAALKALKQLKFQLPVNQKPTDRLIRERIGAACEERQKGVIDLMEALNQRLDRISRHGNTVIEDRRAFFSEAWGKERLIELQFPWIEDVLKTVDGDEYETAGREYVERFVLER
jgi:hypothetical protein